MAEIIPAILEDNEDALREKMATILKIPDVKRIQVDFSDGNFTPHKTAEPDEVDLLNPAYTWEAHLMYSDPATYFFDLKVAGFNNAIIHYESVVPEECVGIVEELKKLNITASLAINPETEIEKILNLTDLFEAIVIMGVTPGYSGQDIDPNIFERIKKLRNSFKNGIIEVDGGVKMSNVAELVAAGADRLIANSALFNPGEENLTPAQNFERLKIAAG